MKCLRLLTRTNMSYLKKQRILTRLMRLCDLRWDFSSLSFFWHDWSSKLIRYFLIATNSNFNCFFLERIVDSLFQISEIDRSSQWQKLLAKKEILDVICFHFLDDNNSLWEWEYDKSDRETVLEQTQIVSANDENVYVKNSSLNSMSLINVFLE